MAAKRGDAGRAAKAARKGAKTAAPAADEKREKMKNKEYEAHLKKLQGELVKLQLWVQHEGLRIVVVFEGRDTAGKGGVIKAITERVSPRVFRIVALPAPTEREKSQLYIQRYLAHFPAAGEVILFDRSWYNRAGVERVMGFTSEKEVERFLQLTPLFERGVVNSGITLIKYWLEVTEEEQQRRFESRLDDPRKIWKLSPRRHAARDRHAICALVYRRLQRPATRTAQLYLPPARSDPLQGDQARKDQVWQTAEAQRLRRAREDLPARAGGVLIPIAAALNGAKVTNSSRPH